MRIVLLSIATAVGIHFVGGAPGRMLGAVLREVVRAAL